MRSGAAAVDEWAATLRQTVREFFDDDSPLYAAALAFFALFATAPLVVMVIAAAAALWGGGGGARDRMMELAGTFLEAEQADAVQQLVANAELPGGTVAATLLALAVLLYAASRVVLYLGKSLNRVWDVEPREDVPVSRKLRKRVVSLLAVLAGGFLLLVSLVASTIVAALAVELAARVPFDALVLRALRAAFSFAVLAGVFAALYKYIPDARIEWTDVRVGAAGTALLVLAGQSVISRAIAGSSIASAFGAAATVIVLLLWFYYTSLVFILGAEFTQVYARRHGKPLRPEPGVARRRGQKTDTPGRDA